MIRKIALILLLLVFMGIGSIFAWESGYTKPTFSFGFSNFWNGSSESGMAFGLDLDFVAFNGLTFGLQNLIVADDRPDTDLVTSIGLGYTFTADLWSIGAKLMITNFMDTGVGADVNGTFWVSEKLGITGMATYFRGVGDDHDWNILTFRLGISARL